MVELIDALSGLKALVPIGDPMQITTPVAYFDLDLPAGYDEYTLVGTNLQASTTDLFLAPIIGGVGEECRAAVL